MRRSGAFVTALTVAALAVLGVLAFQARSSAPDPAAFHHHKTTAHGKGGGHPKKHTKPSPPPPPPVPSASGHGKRVVYSLGQRRVWLVEPAIAGSKEKPSAIFAVAPSGVSPPVGTYAVISTDEQVTGSDGVPVEHVVRFAVVRGVTIGFSAAVDGSSPKPDASRKTGGIREKRTDGKHMWDFARRGTSVVVVK